MKNTIIKVLSIVMAMVMALGTCIVVTATAAAADCKHANYEQYGDSVAATCTTWGYTVYRCSDCKNYFKTEYDALDPAHKAIEGHEWLNETVVKPTCIADGYTVATCSVCKEETKHTPVAKGDAYHDWSDWSKKDATCTDKEVQTRTCKTCAKVETKEGSANGHKWVAQKNTVVAPKCSGVNTKENPNAADGSMVYACSVCGVTKTVVIKSRLEDHGWVYMEAAEDTCDTVGHVAGYFCQWCFAPKSGNASDSWDKIKHEWEQVPGTEADAKEPTCEEDGYWTVKCKNCGKVEEDQVRPATHHEFKDNSITHVDATCTTWGYDLFGCIHCGKIFDNKSYEPLGHKWSEDGEDVKATCTTPAGKKHTCTNTWKDRDNVTVVSCDATIVKAVEGAKPLGHSNISDVKAVAATCTAPGYTAGKQCGVCGEYTEGHVEIKALGHDVKVTVCTVTTGEYNAYEECTRAAECGYEPKLSKKTFSANATESHSYIKTKDSVDATCTTDGRDVLECRFCAKPAVEVVKATGHDIVENKEANRAPNCSNDGYYSDICTKCGDIFNAKVLPAVADAHVGVINEDLSYAATCVKDGQEVGECSICNKPYVKVLPKLGHDMVDVAKKDATCEDAGHDAYSYCKRADCDLAKDKVEAALEPIEALGHKEVKDAAVAATCTTDGLKAGKHCSRCEKVLVPQEKEEKLGHDHKKTDVCAAACGDTATIGYDHYECSRCDDEYIVKYADIPAHVWGKTETQTMTCEQDGFEYTPCTNAGCTAKNIDEKTRVAATGHTNKAGETIVKTCTRTTTDNVCVNKHCNAKGTDGKDVEIKVVHDYFKSGVIAATCIMYEHQVEACKVCGDKKVILTDDKDPQFGPHKEKTTYKDEKAPTFEKAQKVVTECEICGKVTEKYETAGVEFKVTATNLSNPDEKIVNGTKKVQVTIAVRGDKEEIHSFMSVFSFNKDHLEFVSPECGKTIAGAAASIDAYNLKDKDNKDTGKINITAFVSNDVDGNVVDAVLTGEYETLVTLTFKVKGSAYNSNKGFNSSIAMTVSGSVVDSAEQKVTTDVAKATANIAIYKLADVNGDGKYDNVDYLAIQKLVEGDKYDARADLNGDGKVSPEDLGLLQKVLVGREDYTKTADARK